jgi:signal peptidase II
MVKWVLALATALAVIALDQVTKGMVATRLTLHQSVAIIDGFFSLTYVRNTGAAFGFLAGRMEQLRVPFFLVVSMLAAVVLVWFLRGIPAERRWMVIACGAVLGGAVGNMIDRLAFGEVIDFLDVYVGPYHWPTFNVADCGITIGVVLLTLDALRQPAVARSSPPAA